MARSNALAKSDSIIELRHSARAKRRLSGAFESGNEAQRVNVKVRFGFRVRFARAKLDGTSLNSETGRSQEFVPRRDEGAA
jgi:hypothetical protein